MTVMREKKTLRTPKPRHKNKTEKQKTKRTKKNAQDQKDQHPSHSAGYIKDKKTGKWKIVHPAGSKAYNYLYRNEFPDD
jgi:hypothetical protein